MKEGVKFLPIAGAFLGRQCFLRRDPFFVEDAADVDANEHVVSLDIHLDGSGDCMVAHTRIARPR